MYSLKGNIIMFNLIFCCLILVLCLVMILDLNRRHLKLQKEMSVKIKQIETSLHALHDSKQCSCDGQTSQPVIDQDSGLPAGWFRSLSKEEFKDILEKIKNPPEPPKFEPRLPMQ